MQSIYDYPGLSVHRPGFEPSKLAPMPRDPTFASRDRGPAHTLPEFECTQEQAERIASLPNGLSELARLASLPRYGITRAIIPWL